MASVYETVTIRKSFSFLDQEIPSIGASSLFKGNTFFFFARLYMLTLKKPPLYSSTVPRYLLQEESEQAFTV